MLFWNVVLSLIGFWRQANKFLLASQLLATNFRLNYIIDKGQCVAAYINSNKCWYDLKQVQLAMGMVWLTKMRWFDGRRRKKRIGILNSSFLEDNNVWLRWSKGHSHDHVIIFTTHIREALIFQTLALIYDDWYIIQVYRQLNSIDCKFSALNPMLEMERNCYNSV